MSLNKNELVSTVKAVENLLENPKSLGLNEMPDHCDLLRVKLKDLLSDSIADYGDFVKNTHQEIIKNSGINDDEIKNYEIVESGLDSLSSYAPEIKYSIGDNQGYFWGGSLLSFGCQAKPESITSSSSEMVLSEISLNSSSGGYNGYRKDVLGEKMLDDNNSPIPVSNYDLLRVKEGAYAIGAKIAKYLDDNPEYVMSVLKSAKKQSRIIAKLDSYINKVVKLSVSSKISLNTPEFTEVQAGDLIAWMKTNAANSTEVFDFDCVSFHHKMNDSSGQLNNNEINAAVHKITCENTDTGFKFRVNGTPIAAKKLVEVLQNVSPMDKEDVDKIKSQVSRNGFLTLSIKEYEEKYSSKGKTQKFKNS